MNLRGIIAGIAVVVSGCGPPASTPEDLPRPDYDEFVSEVQPILAQRCANPSCHGATSRPFSVYAAEAHRRDKSRVFYDEALSEGELRANYDRARSFVVDGGTGPLLLVKPLAEEAGGIRHGDGEDVFMSPSEREYRIIEDWIEGGR